MRMLDASTGVLIVGHGTTSVVGAEECRRVSAAAAKLLPAVPVQLGFLELIEPSIDDAVAALAGSGCTDLVVVPLLLFSAGHAQRDVPEAVRLAADAHGVAVRQGAVLGCHDAIVELARRRHAEVAVGPAPAVDARILLVGRGSSDPTAPAQLRAFGECVFGCDADVGLGFVAAARPTLDEAIESATVAGVRRVVVHPHLLFHGHVEEQVAARVDRARREHAGVEWAVVPRLGADDAVARAIADRAEEAMTAFERPAAS